MLDPTLVWRDLAIEVDLFVAPVALVSRALGTSPSVIVSYAIDEPSMPERRGLATVSAWVDDLAHFHTPSRTGCSESMKMHWPVFHVPSP